MSSWLEAGRVSVSLLFLAYSSWRDYKEREISDTVWLFFAPMGLFLVLLQAFVNTDVSLLMSLAVSLAVVSGLSFLLFYLDFFGGADAKALICLSIAVPSYPAMVRPYLNLVLPILPLSVLSNAVFTTSMLAFGILVYNASMYVKTGRTLFRGLEDEPVFRKLFLFITGIKVDLSKTETASHFLPLETLSRGSDGEVNRRLHLFPKVNRDEAQDLASLRELSKEVTGGFWVTPSVPFLVFISVGFVITLFLGDVLISLVFSLFG